MMHRRLRFLARVALATALTTALIAAPVAAQRPRPALEPVRVGSQVIVGAYSGIGGYFLGSRIGESAASAIGATSEQTRDRVAFASGVVTAGLATAGSVAFIGNVGDQTGSFKDALLGTAAGLTAGLLLNQLIYGHARLPESHGSSRMRWLQASVEALLPSIGATIAFNSSRRYK